MDSRGWRATVRRVAKRSDTSEAASTRRFFSLTGKCEKACWRQSFDGSFSFCVKINVENLEALCDTGDKGQVVVVYRLRDQAYMEL